MRRSAGWAWAVVMPVWLIMLGLLPPVALGGEPDAIARQRDHYAVVIGISRYRDKRIPPVPYAVDDARAVADLFDRAAGLPRENILLLTDAEATAAEIRKAVEQWVARQSPRPSLVYLYFAGQGAALPPNGDASLIPWDAQPDRRTSLLPLKDLYARLDALPAKDVLVFLDTCFGVKGGRCQGLLPKGTSSAGGLAPVGLRPEGRVVTLLAANGNEVSLEYERARHGLFTHYLLNGLQGEADADRNGQVTVSELFRYAREQVSDTAWGQFFRLQTPTLLMHEVSAGARGTLTLAQGDRKSLARRHMEAGQALQERGDLEGAMAEYRTAVRLAPDEAPHHLRLGVALRDKGDVDGAIVSYRMTLHLRPNDPDAHYLLGVAYLEKGQLEAAAEELRQAIRMKPGFDVAHNNLGHVLEQKGDLAGAIAEYRTAARLAPRDARAHYNLGSALKDRGDLQGAVAELREAVRLKPDYAKAQYHLGVALARLGQRQDSAQALRAFLEVAQAGFASRDMVQDARTRLRALE